MIKQLFCLGMLFALGGCAGLTKSQVETVNIFAETSKNFSAYPGKIMSEITKIRVARGVYFANTINRPDLHIQELDDIHEQQNFDDTTTSKMDVTFKIIDKYAQSLILLTSATYATEARAQSRSLGTGLDSLTSVYNRIPDARKVPAGIGAAAGQLFAFGGRQYIRIRQAKQLKKFVPMADTLIAVMTGNLLEFLESANMHALIIGEERSLRQNYLSYLTQMPSQSKTTGRSDTLLTLYMAKAPVQSDKEYLALKKNIVEVKRLRRQTVEATRALREAHKKLLVILKEKRRLEKLINEVQQLTEGVNAIRATIKVMDQSNMQ
jgi:hypothetical protein